MATLLAHTWTGTQGAAWDSGVWQFTNTGTPTVDIDTTALDATGSGRISGVATDRVIAHLQTPLNTEPTGVKARILRTGAGGFHFFFARGTGTHQDDDVQYGYRLYLDHAGAQVIMRRYINFATSNFAAVPFTFTNGTDYWVYWEVFESGGSTTLRWRIWADGTQEPATWNQELTDSNASRSLSGSVAIGVTPSPTATHYFDDLEVTDLNAAAGGTAALTGDATLSATATSSGSGVAQLTGNATLSASGSQQGVESGSAALTANALMEGTGSASGAATYLEISTGVMLNARYSVASFTNSWFYVATIESPTVNDWTPTYGDTARYKASVQGRLMNIRAANAIFEDEGTNAYVNVGPFNEETNKDNFIAALDTYNDHGVIAFTVSLQGGNPGTSGTNPYGETANPVGGANVISAFNTDGTLKGLPGSPTTQVDYQTITANTWASRLRDICDATKSRNQFLILNLFYQRQDQEISGGWSALQNAITQTVRFLVANNYRHVIFDVANEYDNAGFDYAGIRDDGTSGDTSASQTQAGLIQYVQEAYAAARTHFGLSASAWRAPVGTSSATHGAWSGGIPYFADVAFPHGNEIFDYSSDHGGSDSSINDTANRITHWRSLWEGAVGSGNAGPIVMNEDDNSRYNHTGGTATENGYFGSYNVDLELHAMNNCLDNGASWGLMHRWYMQYTGQPEVGYDTESPDYWLWAEGASATPDGNSSDIYLAAVLDLYDAATRSTTGSAALTSAATLSATATSVNSGSATISANAALSASATAFGGTFSGVAALSASALLTAAAVGSSTEVLVVSVTGSENVISITGDEAVAKRHNIEIPLNADVIVEITIEGSGSISGQNFSGKIASVLDQSVVVLTGTPTVYDGANRIVRWNISDTALTAGSGNVPSTYDSRYIYGVWRTDSGNEYPVVYGQAKFILIPGSA